MTTDFKKLRFRAGYHDVKTLAVFLDVSPRTVKNWDKIGAPTPVRKLLELTAKDLEWISPAWRGFYFFGDQLIGPNKEWITPGMIRAYPRMQNILDLHAREELEKRKLLKDWRGWLRQGRTLALQSVRRWKGRRAGLVG